MHILSRHPQKSINRVAGSTNFRLDQEPEKCEVAVEEDKKGRREKGRREKGKALEWPGLARRKEGARRGSAKHKVQGRYRMRRDKYESNTQAIGQLLITQTV